MTIVADHLTRSRRVLLTVDAAYLLAWSLTSLHLKIMGTIAVFRGPGATWAAFSALWRDDGMVWWGRTLSVASALTNLLFILGFVLAWRRTSPNRMAADPSRSDRAMRRAVWAVGGSGVMNLWWLTCFWGELGAGYYLWVLSFVALSVVLVALRRTLVIIPRGRLVA